MKTLRLGSTGEDVVVWQRIVGVTPDGSFGPKTSRATMVWQREHALTPDGVVGPRSWAAAGIDSAPREIPFLPARHFTRAARGPGTITLVVIHTMEAPERSATAENVASWFAGPDAPQASAHYNVDADSIVQSVEERDIAWHAGPVNGYSIGVEHAGYAKQTPEEWADPYSVAMLERSAELVGDICARHLIPVQRVHAHDLSAGRRHGICGHVDVTMGLTNGRGHFDPGAHFPWDWYLDRVAAHASRPRTTSDATVPTHWVRVREWLVAPRYIAPISIGDAKRLAEECGCELPTPGLVDSIWREADLKLEPMPRTFDRWTEEEMNAPEIVSDQARKILEQIGDRPYRLLAGTHKDIVRVGSRVGLYGWHRLDGKPLQPFFDGHADAYSDYSQGLRLMKKA